MDRKKVLEKLIHISNERAHVRAFNESRYRLLFAKKHFPNSPYVLLKLAQLYNTIREYKKAEDVALQALELTKGKEPKILHELGKSYFWQLKFEKAREYLSKAAWMLSSNLEMSKKCSVDALYYSTYLEMDRIIASMNEIKLLGVDIFDLKQKKIPDLLLTSQSNLHKYSEALVVIANTAYNNRKIKLAKHLYSLANQFLKTHAGYNNLALLHYHLNEQKQSVEAIKEANKLLTPNNRIDFNEAFILLRQKKFKEGWERYEKRAFKKDIIKMMPDISFGEPWKGTFKGKRLVTIIGEQGFGDNIQFIRLLKTYPRKNHKYIRFFVYESLKALFEYNFPEINFHAYKDLPKYFKKSIDNCVFLVSLPRILKITDKNIPFREGYLKAPPENIERMKSFIKPSKALKVGFTWEVNICLLEGYYLRSIPMENYFSLMDIPGIEWYSLQYGIEERPLRPFAKKYGIEMLGKRIRNYSDTFAATSLLDLVISPDTNTVHVAGAMGVPTWAVLHKGADWRWFNSPDENPWYASGRLFYQKELWEWKEPFKEVHKQLTKVAQFHSEGKEKERDQAILFKNRNRCAAF